MSKSLHTVHAGISGFPYANRAAINKQLSINKGLLDAEAIPSVLNRRGVYKLNGQQRPAEGEHEGIRYYTATGTAYRPGSFLKRNTLKIKGLLNEIKHIRKATKAGQLDAILVDAQYFGLIMLYRWLANRANIPMIYHYVELRSQIKDQPRKARMNGKLIDKWGVRMFDGIMPISDVLAEHVETVAPGKPMLPIPALSDYQKFAVPRTPGIEPNFLYCGAAGYTEVVYFIFDAFDQIESAPDVRLKLVIRGTKEERERLYERAKQCQKHDRIDFYHDLPYAELAQKYVDATALLIPLRPTVQDAARFPHKVSEYLASHNPVITTHYGELRKYFVDQENGLVAQTYDIDQYAEKMQWVLDHPEEAKLVGERGYEMGYANFHYTQFGAKLRGFIQQLIDLKRGK